MAAGAFAESPEVGEDVSWYAAALVGDADYDVLSCFANSDFYGWRGGGFSFSLLLFDDGLNAVPEKLANDVFEVGQDVGEGRIDVAGELDGREQGGGWIGGGHEGLDFFSTAVNDFFGVAF